MGLLAAGQLDAAEKTFLKLAGATPDDGGPLYGLGIVASRRGAFDLAATRFERALNLGYSSPDACLGLAESHAMAGRFDRAREAFVDCIGSYPDFGPAHLGLARILSARREFGEAVSHYMRAGDLFAAGSDPGNAIASWEELLAIDPGHPGALTGLARSLLEAGEPEQALSRLRAAEELVPDDARVHSLLGNAYADLERVTESVHAFRRAVELAPRNPSMLVGLGVALSDAGDRQEATECLQKALTIAPEMPEAHFNLGRELFESGRHEEALEHMEACRSAKHGHPWGNTRVYIQTLAPHVEGGAKVISLHKLRHDLEQLEYLSNAGKLATGFKPVIESYRELVSRFDSGDGAPSVLDVDVPSKVRATYNRPAFIPECPALDGPAINPLLNASSVESDYFKASPSLTHVDKLLTPEALEKLRRFCLEGCFWHDVKSEYLGGYMYDGFCCGLLLQIAEELRTALPNILGGLPLQIVWAYKYDSSLNGIGLHADKAAVNVNFWLTPDSANLNPESGGLVVYQHKPPDDWSFRKFNTEFSSIERYLESVGSDSVTVPHRQNRAVIFDSSLFHRTDSFQFRPGYENRRINVTMLYGMR